ncbi:hypothetical protein [Archangium lipolyticum]|uniref:hypothetical protein n=1 Tax=Archangium lipolyticum TaxID=2970465 RepID=UPI002149C1FA|nr:hypothetical protein [Archangium lipolyticum]
MPRIRGGFNTPHFTPPPRSDRTPSSRPTRAPETSSHGPAARYGQDQFDARKPVTVYRVEGPDNQRLSFNNHGDPHITKSFNSATNMSKPSQYDKPMSYQDRAFLNFGDRARAEEFLAVRHDQGHGQTEMKSFQVPYSTFDNIRNKAVPESAARDERFRHRPIQVDVNKADHQYGLNWQSLQQINSTAIPGSGRVVQQRPDMIYHSEVSNAFQDLFKP